MESKTIIYEKIGSVASITLNRPEKRNAITGAIAKEWVSMINEAREDEDVKVLVVTGNGTSFCAGADFLVEMQNESMQGFPLPLTKHLRNWEKNAHSLARTVAKFEKPYICALNGTATGWGMDLASMCDLRIASDKARAAMTYVNIGLAPGGGGCYYLPKIIGLPKTLELIWTGRWMDTNEMLMTGYVTRVVPHDSLMEETIKFASQLAEGPPIAHQFSKKMVYSSYDLDLDRHLELTALLKLINWTTKDVSEGVNAFLEKRKPQFKGI
ncbi:MAG: enoyl-CoA hydratase/isomerase family protein [Deltaproteobacteria bacterium]|nr:enoyl-CoA hydratase/isomerase family protein [Deltaproteobacteria bacterium]